MIVRRIVFCVFLWMFISAGYAQVPASLVFNENYPFRVDAILSDSGQSFGLDRGTPLFTCHINGRLFDPSGIKHQLPLSIGVEIPQGLKITYSPDSSDAPTLHNLVTFLNITSDTIRIANVVPFGEQDGHVYITGAGPAALARAKLFRPGLGPVDVTLPDNAWELGYSSFALNESLSVCALARRTDTDEGVKKRYETLLPPGAVLVYTFYVEFFPGNWQNGLKRVFQERWLYDIKDFDQSLYQRKDLQWIRSSYIATVQFAWDHQFYDAPTRKYNFFSFLEQGKQFFGGYDIYALWPTWPRLGLDERNQWDLYNDLPLGINKLQELSAYAHKNNTRFFISYNPWDLSTRKSDQLKGMSALIRNISADGIVLDTRGSSSHELQAAADSVRDGVIMYSEGMAVPRDMQGILAGRVHDAIFYQPPLNLNKFIKPEFSIFRVCQLSEGRIHREVAISFFNGYGTEINTMAPGRPDWITEEFSFLGRTTRILRENTTAFHSSAWTPLVEGTQDSIWINQWPDGDKILYTVFSLIPAGLKGPLIKVQPEKGKHYVSIWNHQNLQVIQKGKQYYIPVSLEPFQSSFLGTRMEGSLECVAVFPDILKISVEGDTVAMNAQLGSKILVWKGDPSYGKAPDEYNAEAIKFSLTEKYGHYEGKLVFQLFRGGELIDEQVIYPAQGWVRKITSPGKTAPVDDCPNDMVEITAGRFMYHTSHDESFIPYPDEKDSVWVDMPRYFMDRYPVTNAQYYDFLVSTGYTPADTTNFLHHWSNGTYPRGQGNYPVIWVSLDDARQYARWAKKRLPTEMEWQYAAQGTDGRQWPWGNEFHATKCNNSFGILTPVDAFSKGKSPFKVEDMIGNVWQMTNDVYDNGSYYFTIIRGGSYFKPESSLWYIQGGPQPITKRQMMLQVAPAFDRSSTVGFRCVKDAVQKSAVTDQPGSNDVQKDIAAH